MRFEVAPLSGGFMLTGIIGFLFALMFLRSQSLPWATVVVVISSTMLIASMISMTRAPVEEELTLDEHHTERKNRVKKLNYREYKALQEKEKSARITRKRVIKKVTPKRAQAKKKTVKKKVVKKKLVKKK